MKTAPQARGGRSADRNRPPAVLTVASAVAQIGQHAVRWRLRSGRWQRPCRGVLVTHSGEISDPEWLWIAVLAAGPQAVLGGLTAARLDGLTGFDDRAIHLVVPACRQVRTTVPGVVVHRSRVLGADHVHPVRRPPRTYLEAGESVSAAADQPHPLAAGRCGVVRVGQPGPGAAGGGSAAAAGPG
jgi:hypothetical protein